MSTAIEANTIRSQIGNKALYMIGANNISYDSKKAPNLSFKIKGCKTINHIEIILNGLDLYDIKFNKIYGMKFKTVCTVKDVYCDMINNTIESKTNLYTHL